MDSLDYVGSSGIFWDPEIKKKCLLVRLPSVPVPNFPTVLGGVLPAPDPVVPAIPPVPAAPVESADTKMDLLLNMVASANSNRSIELESILARMESLQDSNTRNSRSSVMAKYLQAIVDISVVLNSDKKALNGFVSSIDKKDLSSAKSRASRRPRFSDAKR